VELVQGNVLDVEQVLQRYNEEPSLKVLPAGASVDDPAGLLSGSMGHVLAELSSADLVVVDTPAARLYAEGPAIAAQCDATLVVLSADSARRRAVREFVTDLRRIGARPVGVVLNRVAVDVEALERYTRADRSSGLPARKVRA
jgi:Mrp family chromosome partitioning ATPase